MLNFCSFSTKSIKHMLLCVKENFSQSCLTLWDPTDYTVHGILQARILECVAVPFSRRSFQPRNQTGVSFVAGRFFNSWATREAQVCKFFHSLLKFISTLKRESRPSTKNNLVTSLVVQWLRFHTSGGVIRSLVRELRSRMQCGVALISQNLLIENKTKQNKNNLCVQLSRNDWSASSIWKYVIHLFLRINIL